MTDRTLTVAGARGRSGTTTTAAARVVRIQLCHKPSSSPPISRRRQLCSASLPPRSEDRCRTRSHVGEGRDRSRAHLGCHARRLDQLTDTLAGLLLIVLRGRGTSGRARSSPTAFRPRDRPGGRCGPQPDHRDVCDVWGASRRASPHDRERCSHDRRRPPDHRALRELIDLGRCVDPIPERRRRDELSTSASREQQSTTLTDRLPSRRTISPPLDTSASQTPFEIATELPVPLCGTSRGPRALSSLLRFSRHLCAGARG